MERKITIKYRWWRDGEGHADVNREHVEALEEAARERISDMVKEGYTSGELCENINDGNNEEEYTGWWQLTEECL